VLLPGYQVLRGEAVEEHLLVVRRRVDRIDPVGVAEDDALGIGIPALEDRIAGHPFLFLCHERRRDEKQSEEYQ
jgi:hypothetical protein